MIIFTRTLILYIIVILVMRLMGKRQIGQMQPFELVVALMISELAAVPMENSGIPITNGIIPILTLLIAQLLISFISVKSITARKIICGLPSIIIENGKIIEKNLKNEMLTLNDLLELLRIKGFSNIADVEFAILETNGQLSVIPKSQKRPLSAQDLSQCTNYEGLPLELILDGKIIHKNLKQINLSLSWLTNQLKSFGISNINEILFASIDTQGNLFYQKRNPKGEN